jgi:hypothetical protein
MRIRVIQNPGQKCIDGIELDRFVTGHQYEVGNGLGALFLAEGWGEPADDDDPALVVPLREFDPRAEQSPGNLIREIYPSYRDAQPLLPADRRRKQRSRR